MLRAVSSEREEAQRVREAVEKKGWRPVVAYAGDVRALRTSVALRRVRVVALTNPLMRWDRWWETRPGVNAVWNEWPRVVFYRLVR